MVLVRADGNPQIGSGHIMRCLSLADGFRELGEDVVFVVADDHLEDAIQKQGYECVILNTEYDCLDEELPKFLPMLQTIKPRCVVLDSYFVTPDYMANVRKSVPLVYIDDLNAFDYPVDVVVNYTFYGDKFAYPQNKRYLLGPQYAPLRKEFRNIPPQQVEKRVTDVLLSTGGADPEHVALGCVRYLCGRPTNGITYHVVLGAMNQDVAEIQRLSTGKAHIALHQNVSDMRGLMLQCDAAISAGGTTLFELCACGLPTVTYVLADNQIMNAASFEEAGLMLCAGDIRGNSRFTEHIFERLETLVQDQLLRQRMAGQMQTLVDGNGAVRLTGEILKFIGG